MSQRQWTVKIWDGYSNSEYQRQGTYQQVAATCIYLEYRMNPRIRELMVELKKTVSTHRGAEVLAGYDEIEKFAELIVRECMEQVWYTREDSINGNISEVIKERIEQHFGVEE